MDLPQTTEAARLGRAVFDSIRAERFDEAETLLQQLHEAHPASRDMLFFPVLMAIQRGDVRGAWQVVNGLPEDQNPELKAICLYLLKDPTWHSYAAALEDSSDPYIRRAMFALLGRTEETSVAEPVQSTMLHALQV
ncbi:MULTISPECIES: HrpB1 family type III secretion system apparatus protein [Paraburkholderia]|uniref:HrpB1 family type III secretion system apparatus protein n=1 Tax=Paraburkholderia TaxID=1822464 RepID=UPI0022583B35|nr:MULTISPECIES: HrpB1 family type III secretion system apparatus protein [Paraburkholderia]MCX4165055.1 HrpB1 family type III secretion system apparatus protein [Paraburkholderia megapolitana]MDN7160548.1 HrpB1 family type III secretion system apparatus protein [Paraburkholderia sp. CHISQ3]MDQ6497595.1 HrpB1 family type III secretion system apparatus protein [Paraburkholderia megapolitana]